MESGKKAKPAFLRTKLCYALNPGMEDHAAPSYVLHSFEYRFLCNSETQENLLEKVDSQPRSYSKFRASFSLHKLDYVSRNIVLGLILSKIFHKLLKVSSRCQHLYCFGLYFYCFWLAQPVPSSMRKGKCSGPEHNWPAHLSSSCFELWIQAHFYKS